MNKPPLKISNFTKRYGKFRGIDNVSLELQKSEIFGFLGPNGAGKSTAIRTILNFMKPSEGSIQVFGMDSVKDSVVIKNHIGYLAGDIALYDDMTGHKILEYLTSLGKKTDWKYVKELETRLDASMDRPLKSLSKGNKQKIGLIQAFMHKPDLLILDEPTSGLDPLMKQVFYDMVLEMKAEGKTIFVSSHDLTEVQKICDRAAFIREGKLVSIEDIKSASNINLRKYSVAFNKAPEIKNFENIQNVSDIHVTGNSMVFTITGDIGPFISILAKHNPIDLDEIETSLEDVFMHYYEKGASNE